MEPDRLLAFTPIEHPDPRVQRMGFDLASPYVDQCWSAVVGPSTTLLLRRLPVLWMSQVPATIEHTELARSLGLGAGSGPNSRLTATLHRLVRFGMAQRGANGESFDVYLQVPPLRPAQLERVPSWTRSAHERLFSSHLEGIDELAQHRARVDALTSRLDRMQHPPATPMSRSITHQPGLGR